MKSIDLSSARSLVDFSGSDPALEPLADGQLKAAVALFNMLKRHSFAYLADEVGMGKTYITLGVVAMLRHFNPSLRVLFIAPSENIQEKWIKDYGNFVRHNYIPFDNRVKNFSRQSAVPAVSCRNLAQFARTLAIGYYGDFFVRMSSFSFGIDSEETMWKKEAQLQSLMPGKVVKFCYSRDLERDKAAFKQWYASKLNALLPEFDLVVIDEAHNLKRGVQSSDRNRMLSIVLGGWPDEVSGQKLRPRARKSLLLSATPYDQDYRQLHRQMMVVGKEDIFGYEEGLGDLETRKLIKPFMVRRLSQMSIAGTPHTRNMYRREWREGGVVPGKELEVQSDLQRLVVALFQKKVSEIVGGSRFKNSFQMGMLASFESFFVTAKARDEKKKGDEPEENQDSQSNFDAQQTEVAVEKNGVDSSTVDRIVTSYKETFRDYLPHPKMDAVVERFKESFETGEKHLIFARRVMTVPELKDKFHEQYDRWIMARLRQELPEQLDELEKIFASYEYEHGRYRLGQGESSIAPDVGGEDQILPDRELGDTFREGTSPANFFSWFFVRESGERYLPSRMKKALISSSQQLSTLFEENWLTLLLEKDDPLGRLAREIRSSTEEAERELSALSAACYRSSWGIPNDRRYEHRRSFLAVQKSGLLLLASRAADSGLRVRAQRLLDVVFEQAGLPQLQGEPAIPNFSRFIVLPTFFSELRDYPELYTDLFSGGRDPYFRDGEFDRDRLVLRELIASSLRLGQGVIALYCELIKVRRGFQLGSEDAVGALLENFLKRLEEERQAGCDKRLTAYRELRDLQENLQLLIKVNFPDAVRRKPVELTSYLATVLKEQTPVAGVWGSVTKRSVQQFRMPGYPLILISTDVLQEGEDLHTFCSSITHYGISWTPTAIEQKTGRIDRVGSLAGRRLGQLDGKPKEGDFIQAFFPYLKETVEVYQVRKLCHRMNKFLQRLHTFGSQERDGDPRVNLDSEVFDGSRVPEQVLDYLESPFEVTGEDLAGESYCGAAAFDQKHRALIDHFVQVTGDSSRQLRWRAKGRTSNAFVEGEWEGVGFELYLKSARASEKVLICCSSKLAANFNLHAQFLRDFPSHSKARLTAVPDARDASYQLYVQGEFLFGRSVTQVEEVSELVRRVVVGHRDAVAMIDGRSPGADEDVLLPPAKMAEELLKDLDTVDWVGDPPATAACGDGLRFCFQLGERKQAVSVSCSGEDVFFHALGSPPGLSAQLTNPARWVELTWERNHNCDIVDFHFDADGALAGRVHHPVATIQTKEFVYYAHTLAVEMDRVEQILQGDDPFKLI